MYLYSIICTCSHIWYGYNAWVPARPLSRFSRLSSHFHHPPPLPFRQVLFFSSPLPHLLLLSFFFFSSSPHNNQNPPVLTINQVTNVFFFYFVRRRLDRGHSRVHILPLFSLSSLLVLLLSLSTSVSPHRQTGHWVSSSTYTVALCILRFACIRFSPKQTTSPAFSAVQILLATHTGDFSVNISRLLGKTWLLLGTLALLCLFRSVRHAQQHSELLFFDFEMRCSSIVYLLGSAPDRACQLSFSRPISKDLSSGHIMYKTNGGLRTSPIQ